jgi:hypothetical protein
MRLFFPFFILIFESGLSVPLIIDFEWIKCMKDEVKPRPDDIWVVSYPKSGTTWTQQIVRLVINGGKEDGKLLTDAVPWVEAFNKKIPGYEALKLDEMTSPRAFKSHFPYDQMPCGPPNATAGKYIYVMRNPKDELVSLHIHVNAVPLFVKKDWDDYYEEFLQGEAPYGCYCNVHQRRSHYDLPRQSDKHVCQ